MPAIQITGVGKVTGLWGGVTYLRGPDGKLRALAIGDLVRTGDQILTTQDGIVQLTGTEGATAVADLLAPTAPAATPRPAAPPPLPTDPTQATLGDLGQLDPTAAGLTGGDAGDLGPGLRVDRVSESIGPAALEGPGSIERLEFADPDDNTTDTGDDAAAPGPTNSDPTLVADTATGTSGTPVSGNVLDNDSDADGDTLTVVQIQVGGDVVAVPSGGSVIVMRPEGTLVIGSDGDYTFTPAPGFDGDVPTVEYTVSDGITTGTSTLTITVEPDAGDPPRAGDDRLVVDEDSGANSGNVLDNDRDQDGDALTVTGFSFGGTSAAPGQTVALDGIGRLRIDADGSYVFRPAADYTGPVPTASYTVSDGTSSANATLAITIRPVSDDAPRAVDDAASATEDTPLVIDPATLLANDTDLDGDGLEVSAVGNAENGRVEIVDGRIVFTPDPDHTGPAGFDYTVTDPSGKTSTARVVIDVAPVNDAPNAAADIATLDEDGAATGNLLDNDSDADGDSLTVTQFSVAGGSHAAGATAVIAGVGTLVVGADGAYTFTPLQDFAGAVPTIDYTVSDGAATASATLTLTITPANDAPAALPDSRTIVEDGGAATGNVLTNDSDADGDPLTVTRFVVGGTTYAAGDTAVLPGIGTLVLNTDGSYTYTPEPDFNGAVPTVTYTVSDGQATSTATLDLAVSPDNDGPIARPDSGTIDEDTLAAGNLLANDSDADGDPLTVTQFVVQGTTYAAGTTAVLAGIGTLVIAADGGYVFTPAPDFDGPVPTATYTVSDGSAATTATLAIAVTPVNDAPVAADDAQTIAEDSGNAAGNVLANDQDADGDALTVTQFVVAGNVYAAGEAATIAGVGTLVIGANGAYSFTPLPDFNGAMPSATYTVSDGGITTTATLDVTVEPANDAPVAAPDRQVVAEDSTATGNVLANDADVDGDPLAVTGFEVGGSAYRPGDTATLAGIGSLTLNGDGSYTFVPEPDYTGPVPELTYTVSDGSRSDSSTLNLDVGGVNDAPVAAPDRQAVDEDTAALGNVLDNDRDPDGDPLSVTQFEIDGTSYPGGATATIAGVGALTLNADGSYRFVPEPNFNGSVPGVTYTVSDGTETATSTLRLEVAEVNDPPDAIDDGLPQLAGLHGQYYAFAEGVDGPSLANLAQSSAWVAGRTPDATFAATTMRYGEVQGDLGTDGTLQAFLGGDAASLNVDPRNTSDAVIRFSGAVVLAAGSYNFRVLADDGYSIRIDGVVVAEYADNQGPTTRTHASFDIASPGAHTIEILYWDQGGQAVFQPEISANGGSSYVGLGSLPLAHNVYTTAEDTALTLSTAQLLANDSDADGDPLTVLSVQGATHGTVALVGGNIVFTPDADYNGAARYTYTVSDGKGGTDTATVHLQVTPVDDEVVNTLPDFAALEDTPQRLSGLEIRAGGAGAGTVTTTLEVDAGTLAASSSAGVTVLGSGTSTLTLSGTLAALNSYLGDAARQPTYTSAPNASGPVGLTLTSTDGSRSDTDTATIQVAAVADAPTLAAPQRTFVSTTGFEEGTNSAAGLGTGIWRTHNSGGSVEINTEGLYQGNGRSNRVIELERDADDAGDLYADLTVRAGEKYYVDFSYMARSGALGNSVINVLWEGQTIARLDTASATAATYSIPFIATETGTSRLTFVAEDSNSYGGLLDNLTVALRAGDAIQGYIAALPQVSAALSDLDGSETLKLEVGAIPAGMFLTDGSGGHASAAGASSVDVTGWKLDELTLVLGDGHRAGTTVDLSVNATSIEASNGSTATTSTTVRVNVRADNDDLVGSDTRDDALSGTSRDDVMWGLGGHDTMSGGNGRDTILGHAGNDSLSGGNGDDRLSGGRGNDTLVGGHGSDYLHGGTGDDVLTGGNAGATPSTTPSVTDVFSWHLGEAGSAGAPARDTITDFKYAATSSGGDVLDLRDLLQGESPGSLAHYLHFSSDGAGGTTLSVSTGGGFSGGYSATQVDQQIALSNVNLMSIGTDAQIISDLLAKKQLVVDGN